MGDLNDMIRGKDNNNQCNRFILNALNRKRVNDTVIPSNKIEITDPIPDSK